MGHDIIKQAPYAFRGTDKAFYIKRLQQCNACPDDFPGYMGNILKGETSVSFKPDVAFFYSRYNSEKAELDRFFLENDGIEDFGPIILLIGMDNYRKATRPGLEGEEYVIQDPILRDDIQILTKEHVRTLGDYMSPTLPDYLTESLSEGLMKFLQENDPEMKEFRLSKRNVVLSRQDMGLPVYPGPEGLIAPVDR